MFETVKLPSRWYQRPITWTLTKDVRARASPVGLKLNGTYEARQKISTVWLLKKASHWENKHYNTIKFYINSFTFPHSRHTN